MRNARSQRAAASRLEGDERGRWLVGTQLTPLMSSNAGGLVVVMRPAKRRATLNTIKGKLHR